MKFPYPSKENMGAIGSCIQVRYEGEALLSFLHTPCGGTEQRCDLLLLFPGAVDLAAQSAGIIPGSPLPVLATEGLSGISPLSSDEVTAAAPGQDSSGPQQNGDPVPTMGVSVFTSAGQHCSQLFGWEQAVGLGSG